MASKDWQIVSSFSNRILIWDSVDKRTNFTKKNVHWTFFCFTVITRKWDTTFQLLKNVDFLREKGRHFISFAFWCFFYAIFIYRIISFSFHLYKLQKKKKQMHRMLKPIHFAGAPNWIQSLDIFEFNSCWHWTLNGRFFRIWFPFNSISCPFVMSIVIKIEFNRFSMWIYIQHTKRQTVLFTWWQKKKRSWQNENPRENCY